jgi:hypothetical protein
VGIRRTSDSGRAAGLPTVGGDRSRYDPKEIVMIPIRHLRRLAGVLAGLACTWLGLAVAAPAAFAVRYPTPGYITPQPLPPVRGRHPLPPGHWTGPVYYKVPVHTAVIGGMPGWQIALIAAGAALLAAAVAVLAYRAWAARRRPVTAAA